jgi:hypothetical protein
MEPVVRSRLTLDVYSDLFDDDLDEVATGWIPHGPVLLLRTRCIPRAIAKERTAAA